MWFLFYLPDFSLFLPHLLMIVWPSAAGFRGVAVGGRGAGAGWWRHLLHRWVQQHPGAWQGQHPWGHGATDHQCGQGEESHSPAVGLVLSVFAVWPGWRLDWCCQCLRCGQGEGWTGVVSVCGVARVKVGLVLSVFAVWPGWRLDWCCQCLWCGQGEGWTGVVSVCGVARVKVGLVLSAFAPWPRWRVASQAGVCNVARVKVGLVLLVFAMWPGWRLDWCCQCLQCGQGECWTGVSVFGGAKFKGGRSDWCCRCGQGEGWTGVVNVYRVTVGLVLSVFVVWPGWRLDWCCQCLWCGQGEGWTGVVSVCGVARVKVGLVLSVFVVWPGWRLDWCCQCLQCGQGEG